MKNIVIIASVLCCIGTTCLYFMQNKKQQKLLKVLTDLQYDSNQKHESDAFKIATLKEDINTCYANEGETLKNSMLLWHSCISPWQYNHVIQRLWTL